MDDNIDIFYAMEYVHFLGNRILKVWITPKYIFAAKVKGMTSETTGSDFIDDTNMVVHPTVRDDPRAYVDLKEEKKYSNFFFDRLSPRQFMKLNEKNFVITIERIQNIYHNPKKKWGMGTYPHEGRIYIETEKEDFNKKKKREFILIGKQDPEQIMKVLKKRKK